MQNLLMDHGIFKNHSICNGNSGTVTVVVHTIAWLLEEDRNLVISLSCIVGMGISMCLWNSEARNFFVHGQVEVSAKWGNTIKHAPKYESMWGYGFNSAAYLGKCYSSCIPVQVVDGGCGWRSRYALGYHTTSHHITDLLMLTVFGCGALSGMMRSLVLQVS
ncbi:uncharacterized protein LOC110630850 isoform X4 [Manihot esculenta]|uniref:uncharacterized protein LOC110630850 isoform X4 n=1 Tax=Manihot esculenta TaxID=3983 RepID=UPI000B5D7B08|nr:uncharacterized protein LOC110630850 isoform X4 [Manihot esculenta]